MDYAGQLINLLDEGRVQLAGADVPTEEALRSAEPGIEEFESRYRLDLPGTPPPLSLPAAMWAADSYFRACICLTFREIDAAGIDELLGRSCPVAGDASAHYSVDVVFRMLPDLYLRAKSASRDDPLLGRLKLWASAWPLSSVGIPDLSPDNIDAVVQHDSLRRMYVDRIIATKDTSRLGDPRVRIAVSSAIGLHRDLAPEIHAALAPESEQVESA